MKTVKSMMALVGAGFCTTLLSLGTLKAQTSDALIDALVQKGVITDQEGEDIRAKAEKEWAQSPASKISMGGAIRNIKFYGDVRIRAESRNGSYGPGDIASSTSSGATNNGKAYTSGGSEDRDRFRYRLRFGVTADLYDNFFAGFGVATNAGNQRSGNITFGDPGSNGPFGKGKSSLNVNKVFIGWRPNDYLTFTVGEFDNPLYVTNLTWDANITPAGLAEQYQQDFGKFNVFANAGQYMYSANSFDNTSNFGTSDLNYSNTILFDEQLGLKYKIEEDMFVKGAVGLMTYSGTRNSGQTANGSIAGNGSQPTDFAGPFTGGAPLPYSNVYGINNLAVLDAPLEFDFKSWNVPFRVFGDIAVNLSAQSRSNAAQAAEASALAGNTVAVTSGGATVAGSQYMKALHRDNSNQDMAYQIGLQAGDLKKRGDWMTKAYWQHTGYYSVDPNLVDADIFDGRVNMEGVVLQANYNLNDSITATVTYAEAARADKELATPGTGQDLTINPIDHYRLIQADLLWKF